MYYIFKGSTTHIKGCNVKFHKKIDNKVNQMSHMMLWDVTSVVQKQRTDYALCIGSFGYDIAVHNEQKQYIRIIIKAVYIF